MRKRIVVAADPCRERAARDEQAIGGGPQRSLMVRREIRLDQERKTQKGKQGSEIGQSEKVIWRTAGRAARVPRLQLRAGGAEQNEWQSDREREQAENAPGWVDGNMRAPEHLGRNGQPQQACEQKSQMQCGLVLRREAANRCIRVEIAQKQSGLKENQASGPDGG